MQKLPAMQEMQIRSMDQEDPLEEGMTTHSSILAWEIPLTEEPGGYSPWSRKESDMTEQLSVHTALKKRKDTSSDTKRKVESV